MRAHARARTDFGRDLKKLRTDPPTKGIFLLAHVQDPIGRAASGASLIIIYNILFQKCVVRAVRFKKYFRGVLAEGVYFAPSPFEAGFISAAHTDEDIDVTISAAEKVMATL